MKRNLNYPICLVGWLPAATLALDLTANIDVESDYSTNSRQTPTNEVEEWIHRPGFNVGATHSTPSLTLDANYEFERRFYQEDSFEDENATTGRATLLWNALPHRLDFTVSNSRTETPIESIDPNTPNNRQVVSNTLAGPILRFRTRGDDELQLQYLNGDRSNEVTGNDSTTHDLTARYKLVTSTTNELAFEAISRQTEYDDPLTPELEATVGQVIWTRSANDLELSVMGGYNQSEHDLGREDVDGSIYDLSLDWQARPNTAISIAAVRAIGDQTSALSSGTPEFSENFNNLLSTTSELSTFPGKKSASRK